MGDWCNICLKRTAPAHIVRVHYPKSLFPIFDGFCYQIKKLKRADNLKVVQLKNCQLLKENARYSSNLALERRQNS